MTKWSASQNLVPRTLRWGRLLGGLAAERTPPLVGLIGKLVLRNLVGLGLPGPAAREEILLQTSGQIDIGPTNEHQRHFKEKPISVGCIGR
jgi:hypothetical protein